MSSTTGERPEFRMKVPMYHRSATTRQVHEAVVIWQRSRGAQNREGRILNSKSMFNRCKLQRLVIEDSKEKDDDSIEVTAEDRIEVARLEDDGNSDNPNNPGADSFKTTLRGKSSFNRRTQQNNTITQYYKFRGKNK